MVALPDTQKYLDSSYTYDPVSPGTTPFSRLTPRILPRRQLDRSQRQRA
jgi:hypothetical protein